MYLFLSQKGKIGNPVFISLSLSFFFFLRVSSKTRRIVCDLLVSARFLDNFQ